MLTHILDGQGPLVSLLGELGPHVLVVGRVGVCLEVQFAPLVFEGSVSLFVLSWTSSRSSVDIRVLSAPVLTMASTLRCRSMVLEQ